MKFIIPLLLCTIILLLSGCTCPPKNPDGTKSGPCKYIGPSIQASFGYQGASVGRVLYGDPGLPTVAIPVNKHDPEPVYTK